MADAKWEDMTTDMPTKELEALLARVRSQMGELEPATQDAKVYAAKMAVNETALALVIRDTKETRDAAAKARKALEQAAEERETAADRRRVLVEAEEEIEAVLRQRRWSEKQERQRLAAERIRERLTANAELMREMFLDAATLIALGGTAPSEPVQVLTMLEQVVGIEIQHLFRASRGRAAEELARAIPDRPTTPKNGRQEATP